MVIRSKKGQITLLDLVLAPLAAVILSVIAVMILQGSTLHLVTQASMEPTIEACNFGLETLFSSYYVHDAAVLQYLAQNHPTQYSAALQEPMQVQNVNCGYSCSESYYSLPTTLGSSNNFYVDFIEYFDPFAFSVFNSTKNGDIGQLSTFNMQVFLNSVPALSYTPTEICQMSVFNPEDPSNPYTIYGVIK